MRRMGIVLASIALGTVSLTACSGDDAYCSALEENQDQTLSGLEEMDPQAIEDVQAVFTTITDAAPEEIKPEWETMSKGFDTAAEMINADPADIDPAAAAEAQEVVADMESALKTIQTDAKERCGIEMTS